MGKTAAFIFLAALSAVLWAEGPPGYLQVCGVQSFGLDALSFISVTLALVAFTIAIAYMYSKVREDPVTEVWAKDEAGNLIISVLLFAGILLSFTASCKIAEAYAGRDPFDTSVSYIDTLLSNQGLGVFRSLTQQSLEDQKKATAYLYVGITPFTGSGVAKSASYRALSAQKELVIDMYLPIVASLNAQKYVLQAIRWMAASVLLPFAFILRLIPFTRDYGNMMIAIFFALYIAVPTTYAMSANAFSKITDGPITCVSMCGNNIFQTYGLDGGGSVDEKKTVLYQVGSAIPQAVFIPNLVIVVAVTTAMALSKALRAFAV